MRFIIFALFFTQIISSTYSSEVAEKVDDFLINYRKYNDPKSLTPQEKNELLNTEIKKIEKQKKDLTGQSLSAEKWRKKYQSQIDELKLFLNGVDSNTSPNDIRAEIMVVSEKYHPKDNL